MADNVIINAPSIPGGQIIATKEFGGIQHEKTITEYTDVSGNPVEVTDATPLPVKDEIAENALTSIAAEDFATEATLNSILTKLLASIAVTIASLPLPAGAATAANQQTDALTNTQLRATPVPVSISGGGGGAVTIADGADVTEGAIADAIVAAGAIGTLSAKLRRLTQDIGSIDTKTPALGQALAAVSTPVVLTAAEEVILAAILTQSDFDTKTGSLTETAPATDTASSGLNGRLQRIAQRLTSLIALLPTSLGAGGGLKVDGSGTALPVSGTVSATVTGSVTANAGTNLNTSLLALEAGGNLASILAKLTAAAASFVKLEDVASADGDAGSPVMAIRKATPSNLSGTDGDYEFLQMSAGKLWVQAGATQKPQIGATVVMTVTSLQSLASSATAGWQSDRVSNLSTLANDYEIMVKLTTANTAPANDKAMYVYISPAYTSDAGTTWFQSSGGTTTLPSGSQGTYTIASPNNLRLLGVLNYTTAQAVVQDTFLLSNCFGNRLPDAFSIIIINFSGAALSTGCICDYSPINDILV